MYTTRVDWLIVISLSLAFGAWVTSHLLLVLGVARREGPWRGVLSLVAPPLAPIWGLKHQLKIRSGVWIGSLVLYVVALIAASW